MVLFIMYKHLFIILKCQLKNYFELKKKPSAAEIYSFTHVLNIIGHYISYIYYLIIL